MSLPQGMESAIWFTSSFLPHGEQILQRKFNPSIHFLTGKRLLASTTARTISAELQSRFLLSCREHFARAPPDQRTEGEPSLKRTSLLSRCRLTAGVGRPVVSADCRTERLQPLHAENHDRHDYPLQSQHKEEGRRSPPPNISCCRCFQPALQQRVRSPAHGKAEPLPQNRHRTTGWPSVQLHRIPYSSAAAKPYDSRNPPTIVV